MKSIFRSKKVIIMAIFIVFAVASIITGVIVSSTSEKIRVKDKLELGERYLSEMNYEKALVAFKEVVEIEPRNVPAYLGIAESYIGLEQPKEAVAWLEKGMNEIEKHYAETGELEEDSHKLYLKGSDILADLGDYQESADFLERGLRLTGEETLQERLDEINELLAVKASLPEGTYDEPQQLYLSSMGEEIYYTLDGSMPNKESLIYKEPILLETGATVVKAVAVDEAGKLGEVYTFSYSVNLEAEQIEDTYINEDDEGITEDYEVAVDDVEGQEDVSAEVVATPIPEIIIPVITTPVQPVATVTPRPTATPAPTATPISIEVVRPTSTPTPTPIVKKEPVLAKESDFTFSLSNGKASITKYVGDGGNIIIPKTLGGGEVSKIEKDAFYNSKALTGVEIPATVEEVGERAFMGCSGLTSIRIPKTVTKWGYSVFSGTNVKTATFEEGFTVIPSVLSGCSTLEDIILPSGVKEIGNEAFSYCSNLKDIPWPKDIKRIGRDAFSSCKALTGIEIPSSVEEIGERAFMGCSGLISIRIPKTVTKWGYSVFSGTNIKTATFEEGFTVIPSALSSCSTLEKIVLPSSAKEIGDDAFSYCTNLKSIPWPKDVIRIGYSAFENCRSLTGVEIPSTVVEVGSNAFSGCSNLKSVTFLGSKPKLGYNAFPNHLGIS